MNQKSAPPHIKSKRQLKIWEKQQQENAAKRMNRNLYENQSPFRYAERIYKSRTISQPDWDNVIDCSDLSQPHIIPVNLKQDLHLLSSHFGQSALSKEKNAFLIKQLPGIIVIPNPFTPEAQRKLVKYCVRDYAKPPHTSNLSTHYHVPQDGIWPLYEKEREGVLTDQDSDYYIPLKTENTSNSNDHYTESLDHKKLPPSQLLLKQRWVTLGYQYHWGTKTYDLDRPIPIPDVIADIMKAVAIATDDVGHDDAWHNTYKGAEFKPETGIINYYQLQSTLMGHVDQSEINMEAPLISISLGHACIYLAGGETKETKPIPLKLNSGDIIVVTSIARKTYHGVPQILEGTLPEYLSPQFKDDSEWSHFGEYMSTTRINLNARQVFK